MKRIWAGIKATGLAIVRFHAWLADKFFLKFLPGYLIGGIVAGFLHVTKIIEAGVTP